MKPTVKICGLTREIDIEAAITFGADYLGFIVEAVSPRKLTVEQAAKLSRPAKPTAKTVAVTVNPSIDLCRAIADHMQPNYLQIHGSDLTPLDVRALRKATGLKIIRALPIKTVNDLKAVSDWEKAADILLLDAAPPKGARQQGGHGVSFDWDLISGLKSTLPVFLAGGLTPDNAARARATGLNNFDVSSGLEQAPGLKDASKIRDFMKAIYNG